MRVFKSTGVLHFRRERFLLVLGPVGRSDAAMKSECFMPVEVASGFSLEVNVSY